MALGTDGPDPPSSTPSLPDRRSNGQYAPGNGGGPGRRLGYRSQIAQARDDSISEENFKALVAKALSRALEGDVPALRLFFDRLWPAPKSRLVNFDLPAIESAGDVPKALDAVLAAVASGKLTLEEAAQIAGVVEQLRKAFELTAIEKRLASLEEAQLVRREPH